MNVLQTFIFPTENRIDKTALYVDSWIGAPTLGGKGGLSFAPGHGASFCTFFNAFSHRKWRHLTALQSISLYLSGAGKVRVDLLDYSKSAAAWKILSKEIEITDAGTALALPDLTTYSGELLAVSICAYEKGAVVSTMAWCTTESAKQDVCLAAIVTTFQRETAASRAVESFSSTTCRKTPTGRVDLFVIDNGRTLDLPLRDHVAIIGNPNLGGAGGFARGLSEVIEGKGYTHALFMDDDAFCEPESVWRAMALLAYAKDERLAIAGAMLLADKPTVQYEKGAIFDLDGTRSSLWQALNHGHDLTDIKYVCANDQIDKPNYGGWWFFAFPLAHVTTMPFPFFVRGDDVDFSLNHEFKITTLNGIATWCDNFGNKLSPVTQYLSARSWMALALMHATRKGRIKALRFLLALAKQLALRFDYAGMHAVLDGVEDAFKGPSFFRDNPAPFEQLSRVKARKGATTTTQEEFNRLNTQHVTNYRGVRRGLYRLWGGHLFIRDVEGGLLSHRRIAWEFGKRGLKGATRAISGTGPNLETAKMDRSAFFNGMKRIWIIRMRLRSRLDAVARTYRSEGPAIRSPGFWQKLFQKT